MVMLESTSRINSLRYMTKTRQFLQEKFDVWYHKVSLNSLPNMVSLLTGHHLRKVWINIQLYGKSFESCPTFNFSENETASTLTNFYDIPFYQAYEKEFGSASLTCIHGNLVSDLQLQRIKDLAFHLKGSSYFSLTMLHRGLHESLNDLFTLDNGLLDLLQYLL